MYTIHKKKPEQHLGSFTVKNTFKDTLFCSAVIT